MIAPRQATSGDFKAGSVGCAQPGRNLFAYERRKLMADPLLSVHGWQIKPYRIAYPDAKAEIDVQAIDFAAILAQALPTTREAHYEGVGYAVLHNARDGCYLVMGRWYAGHVLMSDTFEIGVHSLQTKDASPTLERLSVLGCVWELAVVAFEREAWMVSAMHADNREEGIAAYLSCRTAGFV
jgi:hypothetical protein